MNTVKAVEMTKFWKVEFEWLIGNSSEVPLQDFLRICRWVSRNILKKNLNVYFVSFVSALDPGHMIVEKFVPIVAEIKGLK